MVSSLEGSNNTFPVSLVNFDSLGGAVNEYLLIQSLDGTTGQCNVFLGFLIDDISVTVRFTAKSIFSKNI